MQSVDLKKGFWKRMLFFGLLNAAFVVTLLVLSQGELAAIIPILLIYSCTMPFISLLFSKRNVKKAFNLTVLDPNETYDDIFEWYRETTIRLAQKAGMENLPEIAVYESNDMNAFATGRSKNSSLVAVSTALLFDMDADGVEAVIAHEIAHIVNGDMVTQTLLQSFLNSIISTVVLPITITKWFLIFFGNRESQGLLWVFWIIEVVASAILLFFAGLLAKMYSRKREFGADHLASELTHPSKMISALQQLQGGASLSTSQKKYAALQFNGSKRWLDLFSTHPSVDRRIDYLHKKFYERNSAE